MPWSAVGAGLLLAGALVQALAALRALSADRRDLVQGHDAVESLLLEFDLLLHPIRWWRNRHVLAELLSENSPEVNAYRRVRRELWGWSLITWGALVAFVLALVNAYGQ